MSHNYEVKKDMTMSNVTQVDVNTHCYTNPPHDLWAGSGISFFRSPVLRDTYTKFIGTFKNDIFYH